MRFDYHIHTPLCHHAEGHPREYVQTALERGLSEIGFADHNPMPTQFDDWRMAEEDFPTYLQMIEEVRQEFPHLPIRLGLECDFIPGYETHIRNLASRVPFDYLIGAVHYIQPDWDVDNPKKLSYWKQHPVEEVWQMYFDAYTQAAQSGLFDFLAHPDLPKKFGFFPDGDLIRFYAEALDAIADNGLCLEINTAGLRREVKEIYPSRQFLEEAFRRDITILINSDSHHPCEVSADWELAVELAREVGYTELQRFINRQRMPTVLGC